MLCRRREESPWRLINKKELWRTRQNLVNRRNAISSEAFGQAGRQAAGCRQGGAAGAGASHPARTHTHTHPSTHASTPTHFPLRSRGRGGWKAAGGRQSLLAGEGRERAGTPAWSLPADTGGSPEGEGGEGPTGACGENRPTSTHTHTKKFKKKKKVKAAGKHAWWSAGCARG